MGLSKKVGGLQMEKILAWHCSDVRFRDSTNNFFSNVTMVPIVRPGSIRTIVEDKKRIAAMEETSLLVSHYNIKKIFLLTHEDCRAYSIQNLSQKEQLSDLAKAKAIIENAFAGTTVVPVWQSLPQGNKNVTFYKVSCEDDNYLINQIFGIDRFGEIKVRAIA